MKRLEESAAQKKREEEEEEAERKRRAAQPLLKDTAFDRRKVRMCVWWGFIAVWGTDKALVFGSTGRCCITSCSIPRSALQWGLGVQTP